MEALGDATALDRAVPPRARAASPTWTRTTRGWRVELQTRRPRLRRARPPIDGRVYLRPCIVNFRTTDEDVAALVEIAREVGGAAGWY